MLSYDNAITYQFDYTVKYLCAGGHRRYNETGHTGVFEWNYRLRNEWVVNGYGKNKSGGWGNECLWTGDNPEQGGTWIPTMLRGIQPRLGQDGGCAAWVQIVGPDGLFSGIPDSETLYDDLETCRDATGYH
ncbi:MAG: hypothetical protein D6B25_09985 [Desulfobulbaceae bacterium]|nr:MAG: hypothetical protein D6B25_09985 [Desulfobulbaceae bacterium]